MGSRHSLILLKIFQVVFLSLLPLQLGLRFWQDNLLLRGYRIDYLSAFIYPADLVAFVAAIFIGIWFREVCINSFVGKLAMVLFVWNIVQLLWIDQWLTHLFWSFRLFFGLLLVASFKYTFFEIKNYILKILIIQIICIALISILQVFSSGSVGGMLHFIGERRFTTSTPGIATQSIMGTVLLRPYAMFSHPNTMAAYVFVSMLIIHLITQKYKITKSTKLVYVIGTVLLLVSASHTVWLAALVYILICLTVCKSSKKVKHVIVSLFLLFLVLSPLILMYFPIQTYDFVSRTKIITSLQLNFLDLLVGVGWFGSILHHIDTISIHTLQPIHNALWECIVSIGVAPVLMFCVLILLKKVLYTSFFNKQAYLIVLPLCIMASLDHYFITQPQTLYVLLVAVGVVINVKETEKV